MKYTVLMSCGHEDTVELVGKNSERERKIEYFKTYGLCKECYKKMMREKEANEPFNFNVTVLPYINKENGSIYLSVWFSGNTKPYKDDIKLLGGYKWSERESAEDYFSLKRSPLCWNKIITLDELQSEIEKAKSIGAECVITEKGLFASINYQIALDARKEWEEKQSKISKVVKPIAPGVLKGRKLNQKIYGKEDNYSIYPDGEKIIITNEQAAEIKEYMKQKAEYKKKVEEIKKNGI